MPDTYRTSGLRIGEAAEAAGLTVRALHYYDGIGLAAPSGRTGAGHRLYSPQDVERLCAISALRPLGLALAELRSVLDSAAEARPVLTARLTDLAAEVEHKDRLRRELAALLSAPGDDGEPGRDRLQQLKERRTMNQRTVQQPIAVLVYADLERVHRHLVDVLRLGPGHLARDGDGRAVHAELDVGRGVLWLHRESDRFALKSPAKLGGATSSTAVIVADVDAHFAHAQAQGATIEYGPVDQPYGYREYSTRDPEGGLWSFMAVL